MPRTEEANRKIREEQRAKILDAALQVFATEGTEATMAEIATSADVSYGLVYRYFSNKEAIFQALVERLVQFGSGRMQKILEMPGTPGERLHFMISSVLNARRERPELIQLFYHVLGDKSLPADYRERVGRQSQVIQDTMRQLIIEGQITGEVVAGDPEQLIIAVMACFDGLSRYAIRSPERFKEHYPDPEIILRMLKP